MLWWRGDSGGEQLGPAACGVGGSCAELSSNPQVHSTYSHDCRVPVALTGLPVLHSQILLWFPCCSDLCFMAFVVLIVFPPLIWIFMGASLLVFSWPPTPLVERRPLSPSVPPGGAVVYYISLQGMGPSAESFLVEIAGSPFY